MKHESVRSSPPNLWAVILTSSRYWFNYRHSANAHAVYHSLKRLGLEDDHIILMDAGGIMHSPRNIERGKLFITDHVGIGQALGEEIDGNGNLHQAPTEIDYQGNQVNIESLRYVLTGGESGDLTSSSRQTLHSDDESSIFFYFAGHGGDEFFKFHDYEELEAYELMMMFHQMYVKRRYRQMLVILDTCQASTMSNLLDSTLTGSLIDPDLSFYAPNITFISSSRKDENSYAYQTNPDLGVAVVDRYTYLLYEELQLFHNNLIKDKTITAQKKKEKIALKEISGDKVNQDEDRKRSISKKKKKSEDLVTMKITVNDFFNSLNKPYFLHSSPKMVSTSVVNVDKLKIIDFLVPPHLHPNVDNPHRRIIQHIVEEVGVSGNGDEELFTPSSGVMRIVMESRRIMNLESQNDDLYFKSNEISNHIATVSASKEQQRNRTHATHDIFLIVSMISISLLIIFLSSLVKRKTVLSSSG